MKGFDWLYAPAPTPDRAVAEQACAHQAQLTKPPGSLGALEQIAVKLAAMQAQPRPAVEHVWITVFAGDHGVADEQVSAFPQSVTGEMVRNFANGGAAISVLARVLDAKLEVVHLGTVNDPGELPGVRRAFIAPATANFCKQPAMSDEQLRMALVSGAASAHAAKADGAQLFIGGEMGIGNTTSATALACALLGESPASLAGAGTGLDASGIARKIRVIQRAQALHKSATAPLQQLACYGGFEIAALTGAYVAAAQLRLPVLVDGFIATVAALAAAKLNPSCREWMLFAHTSQEQGHASLLWALEATPLLDLEMRLGEASGAATAVPLLRMACELHNGMATFAQAGVSGG